MRRVVLLKSLLEMEIFIDVAHTTHPDTRGHTGVCVTVGDGVNYSKSGKQRINSKSSTESELIGCCEYMPHALWLVYFFHEQGYSMQARTP